MRIKSYTQLYQEVITKVQEYRYGRTHMENYRGHGLREYKLLPGLGRFDFNISELSKKEKALYDNFMEKVKNGEIESVRQPFTKGDDFELKNYWYALFQAQHLGLKTRLMDWSIRWETALLFAVDEEKYHGKDGSLWLYLCQGNNLVNTNNIKELTSISPFDYKKNSMINTPIYLFDNVFDIIGEKRFSRQSGRFWIQTLEKSTIPLNEQAEFEPYLREIIIDGDSKASIKKELNDRGYNLDWNYYRKDDSIDENIRKINNFNLS